MHFMHFQQARVSCTYTLHFRICFQHFQAMSVQHVWSVMNLLYKTLATYIAMHRFVTCNKNANFPILPSNSALYLNDSHNIFLPPATKLRQGNIFTPVCLSVHRGVCHSPLGRHHPTLGQITPGQTPREVHAGIRPTSGRYASYWNAVLWLLILISCRLNLLHNFE